MNRSSIAVTKAAAYGLPLRYTPDTAETCRSLAEWYRLFITYCCAEGCKRILGVKENAPYPAVSHGYCTECANAVMREYEGVRV